MSGHGLQMCDILFIVLFVSLGQLGPGGTVVEGTAGNTGIGLAHMCLAMGYKYVIYYLLFCLFH